MKNRLVFIPAAVIIITLFIVGSFLDLNIAQTFYVGGNGFARFMAAFTMFPTLVFCTFISGLFIRFVTSKKYKKIYQNILLIVFAIGIYVGTGYFAGYNVVTYDAYNFSIPFAFLFGFLMGIPGLVLGLVFYKRFEQKNIIKFIAFMAVAILLTVALVEVLKKVYPRIRYLALMDPKYGALGTEFFSPWYGSNVTEDISSLLKGINRDLLCSFPSGHSNLGFTTFFILMYIPLLIPSLKNKRILLIYIGFAYFLLCASMRMILGMHYLSDTMFAGLMAIIIYFIANEIYIRKFNFIEDK